MMDLPTWNSHPLPSILLKIEGFLLYYKFNFSFFLSCKAISSPPFDNTTPVTPPTVNKKINPIAHIIGTLNLIEPPNIVPNQLNILIPVGIAIIIVAAVK